MRKIKLEELKSYIEELKCISQKEISFKDGDKHFLEIKRYQNALNNGKTITREKLVKNNNTGSAAIILPITEDNQVILIVEPRVFTKSTVGVSIPAGYIENGEEPIMAAKRELLEETGYSSNNLIPLASFYQDTGCSSAYNHAFLALDCIKIEEQHLDNGEYIRYFKCNYDETLELMDMGYIEDANCVLALEKSKKYLKERR